MTKKEMPTDKNNLLEYLYSLESLEDLDIEDIPNFYHLNLEDINSIYEMNIIKKIVIKYRLLLTIKKQVIKIDLFLLVLKKNSLEIMNNLVRRIIKSCRRPSCPSSYTY